MWILGLYILNTVFMLIVAVREVRRPAKALNWLVIGLIFPIIGFGFYLITSNPVRIRQERLTSPKMTDSSSQFHHLWCSACVACMSNGKR